MKNNLYIIIQARMTSDRLPGKVMLPLSGRPVLEVMLDRLRKFRENIIVATTDDGSQQPIVDLCNRLGVAFYEGDTEDVLGRFYKAALAHGAGAGSTMVRLTSDCPLIDGGVVADTINFYHESGADYVIAGPHCGWPRGMDTAVFSFDLIQEAFLMADKSYEREHVTPYIHTTIKDRIRCLDYSRTPDHSHWRLTLDEQRDYEAIEEIYSAFGGDTEFSYSDLALFLSENPSISAINSSVKQKQDRF